MYTLIYKKATAGFLLLPFYTLFHNEQIYLNVHDCKSIDTCLIILYNQFKKNRNTREDFIRRSSYGRKHWRG